jgi:hypothetical protein
LRPMRCCSQMWWGYYKFTNALGTASQNDKIISSKFCKQKCHVNCTYNISWESNADKVDMLIFLKKNMDSLPLSLNSCDLKSESETVLRKSLGYSFDC